ncbi:hypothetical protein DPV78_003542 [Talaromyces pinophilus]|nr:hypothetical protein DPV78_003542 [Talaromyces pinophilus]
MCLGRKREVLLVPMEQTPRRAVAHIEENIRETLTQVMQEGIDVLTEETERWMDIVGSSGKGPGEFDRYSHIHSA